MNVDGQVDPARLAVWTLCALFCAACWAALIWAIVNVAGCAT